MKISNIIISAMIISVSAIVFATYAQTGIDASDLPPMQKEQSSGKTVISGQSSAGTISTRWDSAETKFMNGLTAQEQERYSALKDEFIMQRACLTAIRDSIAKLSPEKRKAAIETLRNQITTRLDAVEAQVMLRLNVEQRNAIALHKSEIAKKREEMKRHIDEIRKRIEQRLQ